MASGAWARTEKDAVACEVYALWNRVQCEVCKIDDKKKCFFKNPKSSKYRLSCCVLF